MYKVQVELNSVLIKRLRELESEDPALFYSQLKAKIAGVQQDISGMSQEDLRNVQRKQKMITVYPVKGGE